MGLHRITTKITSISLLRSQISVNLPHQEKGTYRETYCVQIILKYCHFVTTQKMRMTNRRRNFHTVVSEGSGEKAESRISLVAKIVFINVDRMAPLEL